MKRVVVSLDFELRWGVLDRIRTASEYRANIEGVREVVPRLLDVFDAIGLRATWAIVGAIACDGWDEYLARAPTSPPYDDATLRFDAPALRTRGGREFFAPDLVESVRVRGHELGSHTFSHVYFREPGFRREDAVVDSAAVADLFRQRWGVTPASFVFPRNQVGFLDVLSDHGIRAWRDTPTPAHWRATNAVEQSRRARALRLVDALVPLGRRAYAVAEMRASHFVRVGLPGPLFRAHVARIAGDARRMRDGEVLHLWWHPHNLGARPAEGAARIQELFERIRDTSTDVQFTTMGELASTTGSAGTAAVSMT